MGPVTRQMPKVAPKANASALKSIGHDLGQRLGTEVIARLDAAQAAKPLEPTEVSGLSSHLASAINICAEDMQEENYSEKDIEAFRAAAIARVRQMFAEFRNGLASTQPKGSLA